MYDVPVAPVVLFTGNYGSGKSEVAVNYSAHFARQGVAVKIADLDVVNPYFRCREARDPLAELGIELVAPGGALHTADLPIILPEVRGAIEHVTGLTVLDVGGDNVGATVVAGLMHSIMRQRHEMFFVLNQNRPFTGTVEGALRLINEIEEGARMKVTGIVANTHLVDETDPLQVAEGITFARSVAVARGVPMAFAAVAREFVEHPSIVEKKAAILPIDRMLLPPWKMGQTAAATHSRDGWLRAAAHVAQNSNQ